MPLCIPSAPCPSQIINCRVSLGAVRTLPPPPPSLLPATSAATTITTTPATLPSLTCALPCPSKRTPIVRMSSIFTVQKSSISLLSSSRVSASLISYLIAVDCGDGGVKLIGRLRDVGKPSDWTSTGGDAQCGGYSLVSSS